MIGKPASVPDSRPVETIPSVQDELSALGSANAPFLYFDIAATYGFNNGIANITLEAIRHLSVGGSVMQDRVVVAHMRMGPLALQSLKQAIAGIELLAIPAEGGKSN